MTGLMLFIWVFIFAIVIEGVLLQLILEVNYKKHSLFYKYIFKHIYNLDKE